MNIVEILNQKSALIDEELKKYLPAPSQTNINEIARHYQLMWDYNLRGGKRIRPALCLLTCEALGGDPNNALICAAAIEMWNNFILIHDDIEDESDLRRGKPCLHHICGVPSAINVGDGLHIKAYETLLKNKDLLGEQKTLKIIQEFVNMANTIVEGQSMELGWRDKDRWDVTENEYYEMIYKKTSWYVVIPNCRIGAIVAGCEDVLDGIIRFGDKLGKAFQIQDDLLNLIGKEEKYGKEIGGDIYEAKRTLMLIHLLKNCPEKEKEKIIGIMKKPRDKKAKEEVLYIIDKMKEYGSIDYAKEKTKHYAAEARNEFENLFGFVEENNAKKGIRALIDFVINREV